MFVGNSGNGLERDSPDNQMLDAAGSGNAHVSAVPAGHQRRARRRAKRRDMVVGQPNAIAVELVEIWCLEKRMTMAGQIAVALVVRHDQDDVRLLSFRLVARLVC